MEPIPPRGENASFDAYCDLLLNDADVDETDVRELRRAAWATWRTAAPSGRAHSGPASEEDDEFARCDVVPSPMIISSPVIPFSTPSSRMLLIKDAPQPEADHPEPSLRPWRKPGMTS